MKVAVVGAGVMGLATARVLAQRGHDVTVYEQFELKHARGSSHGTSRIFRLSYDDEHWIRLAQRAYELWRELERESGRTLLELDGLVDVQRVPKRRVEALSGAGVPVEELTPARGARALRLRVRRRGVARLHDATRASRSRTRRSTPSPTARAQPAPRSSSTRASSRSRTCRATAWSSTAGGWAPKLLGPERLDASADARDDRLLPRRARSRR